MSLKNCSKLIDLAYRYLGYRKINKSPEIDSLISECIAEIESINSFKYIYQEFDYIIDVLNKEPYLSYLNGAKSYYVAAMTLGSQIDKKIKYYSMSNIIKMYVFDATSSAYIEYMSNEYEKTVFKNPAYRFCPGYGGSSILDIRPLYEILNASKIGIELTKSCLMLPQKSMIGIIKLGKSIKSCNNCIMEQDCEYKKEGQECYKKTE